MKSLTVDMAGPASIRSFADLLAGGHLALNVLINNAGKVVWATQGPIAARTKATTLTLSSGHVPMLSQPEAVAEFIVQAASSFAA